MGLMVRALGIDPGTVNTGYGVVDQKNPKLTCVTSGTFKTASKHSLPHRLQKIYQFILCLIDQFHPDLVAVEDTFLGKNFKSAIKLGQARGVAILAAQERGLPLFEYSPSAVKLSVTGYGSARKDQIQWMVSRLLSFGNTVESEHASDALAVAICHLHSAKLQKVMQKG